MITKLRAEMREVLTIVVDQVGGGTVLRELRVRRMDRDKCVLSRMYVGCDRKRQVDSGPMFGPWSPPQGAREARLSNWKECSYRDRISASFGHSLCDFDWGVHSSRPYQFATKNDQGNA